MSGQTPRGVGARHPVLLDVLARLADRGVRDEEAGFARRLVAVPPRVSRGTREPGRPSTVGGEQGGVEAFLAIALR